MSSFKQLLHLLGVAMTMILAGSNASAQNFIVGLRFSDNSTTKTITTAETATLEIFVTIAATFQMKEYLVYFSESTPNNQQLGFSSANNSIANWNYGSTLTGDLQTRFSTASFTAGFDVDGAQTKVVDSITITPTVTGTYVIDPGAVGSDVIVADLVVANPSVGIDPGFASVTLNVSAVPEPSTYATVFALGSLAFAAYGRRRGV